MLRANIVLGSIGIWCSPSDADDPARVKGWPYFFRSDSLFFSVGRGWRFFSAIGPPGSAVARFFVCCLAARCCRFNLVSLLFVVHLSLEIKSIHFGVDDGVVEWVKVYTMYGDL